MTTEHADVVIVGAGVCGLTAATRLVAAGHDVVVVEARDRVGGRLETREIDGVVLELGGQWVSPEQDALKRTLAELGLTTFQRYRDGDSLYVPQHGDARRFTGEVVPTSAETAAEIGRMVGVLDALVAEVDPDAPWDHPRAGELDAVSWSAFLEQLSPDAEARANVALYIADAMLTKRASDFSALQALLMAASATSFSTLVDADEILDARVVGGLQLVPIRLAAALGDRVRLGHPVRSLAWGDDGVTVTADGLTVTAKRVLMAVPPNLYDRVAYAPPLPGTRQQAHQHMSLGLVLKVHAAYPTPFWREAGLSGTAFSPWQLVHEAYDNSNHGEETGILVGFVSDAKADAVLRLSADERRARILDSLATYYGPAALEPTVYYESDWVEQEWTRGAYAASFDIGGLTRFGALLLEPVGPIHWGSSDLAGLGYQHVDGAIRVGERVAAEIAAAL